MKLQLIRNATLVLDYGGHRLLLDPDFASRHTRPPLRGHSPNPMVDLPLPVDEIVAGVELVLVSHLHQDHFDATAAAALPKDLPLLCQGGDEQAIEAKGFRNVRPVAEAIDWHHIRITRTPGSHGSGAVLDLMGAVSGWVLEAAGEPRLYWAGDTILNEEVRRTLGQVQPDVVVTHSCGAVWQEMGLIVMDAAQTLELCQLVPKATVVAVHLDALDHATVSRAMLRVAAEDASISPQQLRIPTDGETLTL